MSRRVKSENQQILKILLDRDNTTAAQLAEEIGISEKTVRNRIKEVNALLGEKKLGEIISKPKKGMILEADLKQKNQIRLLLGEVRRSDSTDETGRMSAVLRMILRSIKTPGITINEIADALCREQIARIDEGKKPAYSLADAGILVRLLDVIVHNQEDMLERYTLDFAGALEIKGIDHVLRHMGSDPKLTHAFPVLRPDLPESERVFDDIVDWFKKHEG